jgi:hypothetical protein
VPLSSPRALAPAHFRSRRGHRSAQPGRSLLAQALSHTPAFGKVTWVRCRGWVDGHGRYGHSFFTQWQRWLSSRWTPLSAHPVPRLLGAEERAVAKDMAWMQQERHWQQVRQVRYSSSSHLFVFAAKKCSYKHGPCYFLIADTVSAGAAVQSQEPQHCRLR